MRTPPGADGRAARWVGIRILSLAALLVIGLSVVAGRVFWLQVLRRERYAEEAVDQYLREVVQRPRRGVVTDRNGVLLAVSTDARSVYADPSMLDGDGKDPRADRARRARIVAKLAQLLKADARALEKKLARGGRFVWLERRIGPDRAGPLQEWLDAEKVKAIRLVPETRRYYPKTELAGQVLGVVDDEGLGREGVELAEDDLLRGAPEKVPSLRDAKGRMVLEDAFTPGRAREGARVVLTIDLGLQAAAETALARSVASSHAASAMAVVLAPGTGEILALATYPTANANAARSTSELRNRPVVDAFEPGSTIKAMTLATALEAGAIRPGDWIDTSNGRLEIGKHVINDTHRIGSATPARILIESSNVGAARVGWRVGAERLHAGLTAFGFGEKPGTGLPGEVRGVLNPARGDVDLATQSFGQGPITASALQITNAMAVFANKGVLVRPQLVKRVVDPATGETLDEPHPEPLRQVVKPQVAEQLTKWLIGVVEDDHGTGRRARVDGWRVAGKTGTAQKADHVGGGRGYSDRRFSSFVGFAPVDQPRFVIGVFVDEPRNDTLGGLVAAPAFREIAAFALRRDAAEPLAAVLAAATPPPPAPAEAELEEEPPGPDPVEETEQAPAGAGAGVLVPTLDGLSARVALQRLEAAGLEAEVVGAGLVVGQSPPPGRKVERGSRVRMRLAPAG